MSKKSTKALASAALMSLVLTTALSAGPVKAAQGKITRVSGADRYATASQVATTNWADGSDNVVLVSGEGYADAVSASALAKKLDAPILLTQSDSLSADAQTALETLKPKNIYVVGGTASISQSIRDNLAKSYTLTELGGANRYETNTAVAEELVKLGVSASDVLVVGGEGFSDALSVAPVAAAKGQILLLANNNSSQPAIDFVKENNSKATVVGTSNVINDTVYNALGATTRVDGGADRFETNLNVLKQFKDSLKTDKLYIANASAADPDDLYADALVASAVAGKYSAPLVLVDKDPSGSTDTPNATDNAIAYIKDNTTASTDLQLIGGTGVVSQATEDAINKIYNPDNGDQGDEVQSITTNGLRQIKVEFNGEVDQDTAEDLSNYTVDGSDLSSSDKAVLQDDNKTVLITLADQKKQNDSIDVKVKKGILSADKSSTIPEFTQNVTFSDTTAPTLDSVGVRGNKKITVKFSEPVNVGSSANANGVYSKFKINDKNISSFGLDTSLTEAKDAVEDSDGHYWTDEIDFYFTTALDAGNDTLKVSDGDDNALEDAAGFPIAETTEDFNVDTLTTSPDITSITAEDSGKVYVNFDRAMDKKTATTTSNYQINGQPLPSGASIELKKDDTQVKISGVSDLLNKNSNNLYIKNNVKDAYGNKVADDTYKSFDLSEDTTKPSVQSVTALDDNTIRVRFSKDVDASYATSVSNYKLRDNDGTDITSEIQPKDSSSSNYQDNKAITVPGKTSQPSTTDIVDIHVKDDLSDSQYSITIKNIQDTASTPNVMDDYTGPFDGSSDVNAKVTGVYGVSGNDFRKVTLTFNKEMDSSTLNDISNYKYVNKSNKTNVLPSAAEIDSVSSDNKSVTIKLPSSYTYYDTDGNYNNSITSKDNQVTAIYATGVKDTNGNALDVGNYGGTITPAGTGATVKANSFKVYYDDSDNLKADVTFTNSIDTDNLTASDFILAGQPASSATANGSKVILTFNSDNAVAGSTGTGEDASDANTVINTIKAQGENAALTIKDNPTTTDVTGAKVSIDGTSTGTITPYFYDAAPKTIITKDSNNKVTNWTATVDSITNPTTATVKVVFDTPIDINSVSTSDFTFTVGGTTIDAYTVEVVKDADGNPTNVVNFTFNTKGDSNFTSAFTNASTIKIMPKDSTRISTLKDGNGDYTYYVPSNDDLKGITLSVTAE
jgi:putative cell wall-binding protein